MNSGS